MHVVFRLSRIKQINVVFLIRLCSSAGLSTVKRCQVRFTVTTKPKLTMNVCCSLIRVHLSVNHMLYVFLDRTSDRTPPTSARNYAVEDMIILVLKDGKRTVS